LESAQERGQRCNDDELVADVSPAS